MLPDGHARRRRFTSTDGRIAVDRRDADRPAGARAIDAGRARGHARPRRHPRPHQRAGPHRLGRVRDGDARGGGGRHHDARRHAAQQHSADHDRRRARGQAPRGRRADATSMSASGAASCPGNARDLEPLARAGVLGFKCFLSPSGVDEFAHVERSATCGGDADRWHRCGCRCWRTPSGRRCCAIRGPATIRGATRPGCDSRPPAAEHAAIDLLIDLAGRRGARVHIVHLASADALPAIAAARATGLTITVETCPHYLTFCAEEIADGATALKCAPPIRERDHRERLWRALRRRRDRSRRHRSLACAAGAEASGRRRFPRGVGRHRVAADGVAGRCGPARGSAACRSSGWREWMSAAPARLAGLDRRKGAHRRRSRCRSRDLSIPIASSRSRPRASIIVMPVTPYDGARLHGAWSRRRCCAARSSSTTASASAAGRPRLSSVTILR